MKTSLLSIAVIISTIALSGTSAFAMEQRTVNRDVKAYGYENIQARKAFVDFKREQGAFRDRATFPSQSKKSYMGKETHWDTDKWPAGWTMDSTLTKMYDNHVFIKQYTRWGKPALKVGKMFHDLSDLDKSRSLKLLSDYFGIFDQGFVSFQVRDGKTGRLLGHYRTTGFEPK